MRLGPLLILAWSALSLVGLVAMIAFAFTRGMRGAAIGLLMFLGGLLSGALVLAWIGAVETPAFSGSALFFTEIIVGLAGLACFVVGAFVLGRDRQS